MSERLERIKEMLGRAVEASVDDGGFVDEWVKREAAQLDREEFEELGRWIKAEVDLPAGLVKLAEELEAEE